MTSKYNCLKCRKGFSLVELLIVLALLAVTIEAIYLFFSFVQTSFASTDDQTKVIQEANLAVLTLEKDIRSASRPNADTKSVVVLGAGGGLAAGQSMDIYMVNSADKYLRVSYRLLPTDKKQLQRGWVECTTTLPPVTGANPQYATVTNWNTILDGVAFKDESNADIRIFTDTTGSSTAERRKIQLNLSVNDPLKPLPKPVVFNNTLTSRSRGTPQ